MSWVADTAGDLVGSITGSGDVADASREGAQIQASAAREAMDLLRGDLEPFREAGQQGLDLLSFLTDQSQRTDFLGNNAIYNAGVENLNQATMNNRAARGKLGSGGTLDALQQNAMIAGLPLLDRQDNSIMNLVNLGQNSAALSGSSSANLLTQAGNAQAAGLVGGANADAQGRSQFLGILGGAGGGALLGSAGMLGGLGAAGGAGLGGLMALCDERAKEDIREVGQLDSGLKVYVFKYKGDDMPYIGVMAQEAEKIFPDAVKEINGLKHVDYAKVA